MSYRAPPVVLPSLRSLGDLPGSRLMWPPGSHVDDELSRERLARERAVAAPCPAFATWPPRGVTVGGHPVLRLPPREVTVQPGENWRDALAASLAPGRPVFG